MAARRAARPAGSRDSGGKGSFSLFIWAVLILLLFGIALGCWIGSIYLFANPEKPISYSVLTRLNKLDPPKRFELVEAPRGIFLSPEKLMERYGRMNPAELARENEKLLRHFIRNYNLTNDRVPYVVGKFRILDSFQLDDSEFVDSGVVVIAQAENEPTVLLEQIFPAGHEVVPTLHRMLLSGLDLELQSRIDLAALLHIKRLDDGRMQFTTFPILYGSYAALTGPGTFSLDPPESLNPAAGLPVLDSKQVEEATEKFASRERRQLQNPDLARLDRPQLIRVERPQPVQGDAPEIPAASPVPTPVPSEVVTASPPPTPAPTEPQPSPGELVADASPSPTASPTPTPAIANIAAGSWPTYSPGRMPRGRLINVTDTSTLASTGVGSERIYLQGTFLVTASGANRAVLRAPRAGIAGRLGFKGKTENVRVIAEFPNGVTPPPEGSEFSRDSLRPFQITRVRRAADGQINVYVREITR